MRKSRDPPEPRSRNIKGPVLTPRGPLRTPAPPTNACADKAFFGNSAKSRLPLTYDTTDDIHNNGSRFEPEQLLSTDFRGAPLRVSNFRVGAATGAFGVDEMIALNQVCGAVLQPYNAANYKIALPANITPQMGK